MLRPRIETWSTNLTHSLHRLIHRSPWRTILIYFSSLFVSLSSTVFLLFVSLLSAFSLSTFLWKKQTQRRTTARFTARSARMYRESKPVLLDAIWSSTWIHYHGNMRVPVDALSSELETRKWNYLPAIRTQSPVPDGDQPDCNKGLNILSYISFFERSALWEGPFGSSISESIQRWNIIMDVYTAVDNVNLILVMSAT